MRLAKPSLRDSFFGWLGVPAAPQDEDVRERQREIRERMVTELMDHPQVGANRLIARIHAAQDIEELWYHRPELMMALCRARGESDAAAALSEITELFDGLMPASMMRSGPRKERLC